MGTVCVCGGRAAVGVAGDGGALGVMGWMAVRISTYVWMHTYVYIYIYI